MKQRRVGGTILAVVAVATVAAAALAVRAQTAGTAKAGDWPCWRGPNRDGISTETGWRTDWNATPPAKLWSAKVGKGYSAVVVANGLAYTVGNADKQDTVYCFDAATGAPKWKQSYPCDGGEYPGPRATPTVDGGCVYTVSRAGQLACWDAATGQNKWGRDLAKELRVRPGNWGFSGSPVVIGNVVIVDVGVTIAMDKATGRDVWKSESFTAGYSTPLPFKIGQAPRLAVFNGQGLTVLDGANGGTLVKVPWKTSYDVHAATPIVADGKVFISSGYNSGCALLDVSGPAKEVWKNKNMRNHFNSCVLVGGSLYGFDESELRCIDLASGDVKWSQKGLGKGSLMVADGKMIIQAERGDLVVAEVSPEAYKEIARVKGVLSGTCWTVPVLAGGRIYCRNDAGDVVCLDVSGK